MNTFNQYLSERANEPVIRSIIRNLMEAGIDPVRYVYFRLVEDVAPPMAANQAGSPNPTALIQNVQKSLTMLLQQIGQNNPQMTQPINNMNREAQMLAQKVQQQAQKPPMGQPAPGQAPQAQPTAPVAPAQPVQ